MAEVQKTSGLDAAATATETETAIEPKGCLAEAPCGRVVAELQELTGLLPDLLVLCNQYTADAVEYRSTVPPFTGRYSATPDAFLTLAIDACAHGVGRKRKREDDAPTDAWFRAEDIPEALQRRWPHSARQAVAIGDALQNWQRMVDERVRAAPPTLHKRIRGALSSPHTTTTTAHAT